MFHVPVLLNACESLSLPASFVLLFASVFYGQRPIHYLQAALLFLLVNAVHCLAFPSLHGLVFVFSCHALSPGITFAGISVLSTDWSAVLSSYPECWCHISPTWCIRISILSGPTHDLSFFSKLRCDREGLNGGAWWPLLKNSINWDALLYFAVLGLSLQEI